MTSRVRILAVVMALPTLGAALMVLSVEAWRLRAPESPLFVTPFAYSLADAVARDDVQRAFTFIRAGQDPNVPIMVRDLAITGDRTVQLSPLLWAVATDARQSFHMLLGYGARWDLATERAAVCIARAWEHEQMIEVLNRARMFRDAVSCPEVRGRAEMLAAFAAE